MAEDASTALSTGWPASAAEATDAAEGSFGATINGPTTARGGRRRS